MLDIGGWEIFLILALALIIVGPKDLPMLVRKVGTWVGKARSMARDFQSGMNEAAREMELDELKKTADVGNSLRDEGRRINSDVRRSFDVNGRNSGAASTSRSATSAAPATGQAEQTARAPAAASTNASPAAVRAAGLERRAPERATETVGSSVDRRPPPDARASEDDAVLTSFQRGLRDSGRG